ncbi:uncharacterized protein SCHCODRAFT_02494033 [Schizophyllum commune H4-8]|nr:uncharacterized protein SCHCODRAFT_02494033 [Schizophyllum commune H4-8]KAI5895992.1 hypothetical protein SCHCODRAFT_02494033 [Schizophyllum commune H4-8]
MPSRGRARAASYEAGETAAPTRSRPNPSLAFCLPGVLAHCRPAIPFLAFTPLHEPDHFTGTTTSRSSTQSAVSVSMSSVTQSISPLAQRVSPVTRRRYAYNLLYEPPSYSSIAYIPFLPFLPLSSPPSFLHLLPSSSFLPSSTSPSLRSASPPPLLLFLHSFFPSLLLSLPPFPALSLPLPLPTPPRLASGRRSGVPPRSASSAGSPPRLAPRRGSVFSPRSASRRRARSRVGEGVPAPHPALSSHPAPPRVEEEGSYRPQCVELWVLAPPCVEGGEEDFCPATR